MFVIGDDDTLGYLPRLFKVVAHFVVLDLPGDTPHVGLGVGRRVLVGMAAIVLLQLAAKKRGQR